MAESKQAAAPVAAKPKTITLTFGEEDTELYNAIVADAKADRRTTASYLVIHLAANYFKENA